VLSTAPFRGIGLVSYSLYLWHWPLIVFVHRLREQPLDAWGSAGVIAASFVLAGLSWRCVEQAFRRPSNLSAGAVRRRAAIGLASAGAGALAIVLSGGWPSRFSPDVVQLAQAEHDVSPFRRSCHDYNVGNRQPCTLGAEVTPTAVLWGDSHGVELAYALSLVARAEGWSLVQRTHSSCAPVLGYDRPRNPACAPANRKTFEAITSDPAIRTVYLSAFWRSSVNRNLARNLDTTIAALLRAGKRVVVIGPVPGARFDVPRRLAQLARDRKIETANGYSRTEVLRMTDWFYDVIDRWGDRVTVIEPMSYLCRGDRCDVVRDGKPLYFDYHHLSVAGAQLIIGRQLPQFAAVY